MLIWQFPDTTQSLLKGLSVWVLLYLRASALKVGFVAPFPI